MMNDGIPQTMGGKKKVDGYDSYDIKDAARTLMSAIEIRSNPKLFPLAQKAADEIAKHAIAAALEKKVAAGLLKTFGGKK